REELVARLAEAKVAVAARRGGKTMWYAGAPLDEDDRRVAFILPGQGAQAVGLCRALYERFDRFRARLDDLAAGVDGTLPPPRLSYLYPQAPYHPQPPPPALTPTALCPPAL